MTIKNINNEIKKLKPYYDKYLYLQKKVQEAKDAFNIGEFVKVEETCVRGCCVELEFEGSVVGQDDGFYEIMSTEGKVYRRISKYYIKRIGE